MLKTRIIPCLLLQGQGLVKTVKFEQPKYVGDPINAVKIFNDKEVDELIFLDISAGKESKTPNFELIEKIASECFMPLCYGGGVSTFEDVAKLFAIGVEKIAINTHAIKHPEFVTEAAKRYGSQSIVVSIDAKKSFFGTHLVCTHGGAQKTKEDPVLCAIKMERAGAGELLINSIDRDGTGEGYDLELIKKVSNAVSIPVVACGGAGAVSDFEKAVENGASAVAAGSFFVFQGPHRAVLISYPKYGELEKTLL